jgi:hypothetical protein
MKQYGESGVDTIIDEIGKKRTLHLEKNCKQNP